MIQILNPGTTLLYGAEGLDREQQQQALDLELRFDSLLVDAIRAGMKQGQFSCMKSRNCSRHRLPLSFSRHLKQWKLSFRKSAWKSAGIF